MMILLEPAGLYSKTMASDGKGSHTEYCQVAKYCLVHPGRSGD